MNVTGWSRGLEVTGSLAEPVCLGASVDLRAVVEDLGRRQIGQLMVEGGSSICTEVLTAGLADEIRLAIAPFFVGDPGAPQGARQSRLAVHDRS